MHRNLGKNSHTAAVQVDKHAHQALLKELPDIFFEGLSLLYFDCTHSASQAASGLGNFVLDSPPFSRGRLCESGICDEHVLKVMNRALSRIDSGIGKPWLNETKNMDFLIRTEQFTSKGMQFPCDMDDKWASVADVRVRSTDGYETV